MKFIVECPDYPSNVKPCKYSIKENYKNCLCNEKYYEENDNSCCQDSLDWFVYIDNLEQLIEIQNECKEIRIKKCPWKKDILMFEIHK